MDDKSYGSLPSAAQSTSSVAQMRPGDSLASLEKGDLEDDVDDDEPEDGAAGMATLPFAACPHQFPRLNC